MYQRKPESKLISLRVIAIGGRRPQSRAGLNSNMIRRKENLYPRSRVRGKGGVCVKSTKRKYKELNLPNRILAKGKAGGLT
jgi:hypothetical protein